MDIDVARPSALVGLAVELSPGEHRIDPDQRRRLDVLLGPDRSAALVALAGSSRSSAPLDDPPGRRAGQPADDRSHGPQVPAALQHAALARAIAGAGGVPPLARSIALLEAAAALASLPPGLQLAGVVRRDLRGGVDMVVDLVADGAVTISGERSGRAVAALLRRAARLGRDRPLAAARLAALAGEIERGRHTGRDAGPMTPVGAGRVPVRATARRRPPGRRLPVDVGSLSGTISEAAVAASRVGPAEVEVRVGGWADRRGDLWARGFHGEDGTLLAAARLRADGDDAVARLLVPPDAIRGVEIDVTDRPEMPRPTRALASVQRAIYAGHRAAQAERLADVATATLRWRQCARAWLQAGDGVRAEQAQRLARSVVGARSNRRAPAPVGAPLVADLLLAGR